LKEVSEYIRKVERPRWRLLEDVENNLQELKVKRLRQKTNEEWACHKEGQGSYRTRKPMRSYSS
jgi:hypothetical protein